MKSAPRPRAAPNTPPQRLAFAGSAAQRAGRALSIPACLHCGVCCFSRLDAYVRVTGDDWTRLGADAGRVAHFIGHRAYMRMAEGHCAALQLRRTAKGVEFFCTVYENRPQVCRDLPRGSPECEGELAAKAARTTFFSQGTCKSLSSSAANRTLFQPHI